MITEDVIHNKCQEALDEITDAKSRVFPYPTDSLANSHGLTPTQLKGYIQYLLLKGRIQEEEKQPFDRRPYYRWGHLFPEEPEK